MKIQDLQALSQEQRVQKMQEAGFNADEIAFYQQAMTTKLREQKPETRPWTLSDEFKNISQKIDNTAQLVKSRPPGPEYSHPAQLSAFERDILLNRLIIGGERGGESILDGASFHNPDLKPTRVTQWFENEFRPMGYRSAMVLGAPGTGKTWGSLAFMNSLTTVTEEHRKVVRSNSCYITAFDLANKVNNPKRYQSEIDSLISKRLLLIDDLGAEPSGYRGADFIAYFDYLFSERHKFRRYTFLTSNAGKTQVKEIYGERFISRFNEIGKMLETADSDIRQGGV